MKQLEKRFYARKELAELFNIDIHNAHFARDVKNELSKWGYEYEYSRTGATITKIPTSAKEKLSEIMIRKYNLDVRVNVEDFACFIIAFDEVEGFAAMPWAERQESLSKYYGVMVDERTLRNWCSKLLATNTVVKGDEKSYWCTQVINGEKTRMLVDGDEELEQEMLCYWNRRKELINKYTTEALAANRVDYKQIRAEAWKEANSTLWTEFGCCYYSCKSLVFSAFDDFGLLEELYELINEAM